jgi:hypothetical protein
MLDLGSPPTDLQIAIHQRDLLAQGAYNLLVRLGHIDTVAPCGPASLLQFMDEAAEHAGVNTSPPPQAADAGAPEAA